MLSSRLHHHVFALRPRVITASRTTSLRRLRPRLLRLPERSIQTKPTMQQPDWDSLIRSVEDHKAALLTKFPNLRDAHNIAVKMKRYLEEDGHRIWGQVIYRCTYDNDGEWQRLVEELQSEARKALEFYNGLDLWDSFRLTIFEDRARFDGATPAMIREHFREWARTAPDREQPPGVGAGFASRYEFCVMVDKPGLDSVIHKEPNEVLNCFVNLVTKDLVAVRAEFTDDMDPEEEINGFKIDDFNWMRANYRTVLVGASVYLRNIQVKWPVHYRRPPEVALL